MDRRHWLAMGYEVTPALVFQELLLLNRSEQFKIDVAGFSGVYLLHKCSFLLKIKVLFIVLVQMRMGNLTD